MGKYFVDGFTCTGWDILVVCYGARMGVGVLSA